MKARAAHQECMKDLADFRTEVRRLIPSCEDEPSINGVVHVDDVPSSRWRRFLKMVGV